MMRSYNSSAPWGDQQYSGNSMPSPARPPDRQRSGSLQLPSVAYTGTGHPQMPMPMPSYSTQARGSPSPSFIPPVLTPRTHPANTVGTSTADLFFQSPTSESFFNRRLSGFAQSQSAPPLPPPPVPRYPIQRAVTSPPIPPKPSFGSPPSLPPKIPLYPQSIPGLVRPSSFESLRKTSSTHSKALQGPSDSLPPPTEETEDDELAMVLALSAAEADRSRNDSSAQEEEDLARAMRESALSDRSNSYFPTTSPAIIPDSLLQARSSVSGSSTSPQIQSGLSSATPLSYFELEPERQPVTRPSFSFDSSKISQLAADEALARQLAAEEEEMSKSDLPAEEQFIELPTYMPTVQKVSNNHPQAASTHSAADPLPTETTHALESTHPSSLLRRISSSSSSPSHDSIGSESLPGSTASASVYNEFGSRPVSRDTSYSAVPPPTHLNTAPTSRPLSHVASRSNLMTVIESQDNANNQSDHSPAPVSANQFVEPGLFQGISLGFHPPVITTELAKMQGPMPNIISLPYGRCPPLHIQAPSWRHLLKLMARLSGTRVEATLEALAVVKVDMCLRTVVQFVKVHHSSPDWRIILWLTIDYPIPDTAPAPWKYSNGDVSALPYSYSFSSVPTLLRDGVDSPMAKAYTIPVTANTPYPKLPISFPNLAMYLQSALEDSRRVMHDSSSGIRKLARMVDACSPNEAGLNGVGGDPAERRTVGGLFRKVIGRGNRQSRGRGNEDTFELVTPFVPDELEWG